MEEPNKITPHDLIKKHIENKEHVVTDEELQKLKVGDEATSKETIEKEIEEKDEEIKHKPHLPNPYDVL